MAEIPRDIGQLAKTISNHRVENTEDVRILSEMLRAFCMDASEVIDLAEYELRSAISWFDRGSQRRAKRVTRPLRHAQALVILAARRAVAVYKTYLREFEEELSRTRNRGQRRFNPGA